MSSLPNGARVYLWALEQSPILWSTTRAAEAFGVPPRTIRHWKGLIEGLDEGGNPWPKTATGPVKRQPIATSATSGRKRQPIADSESGNPLPKSATDGQLLKGGELGGGDAASKYPKPKTKKKARKVKFEPLPADWTDEVLEEWRDFIQMRKEKGKTPTPTAHNKLIKKVKGWDHQRLIAALTFSTENSYTGLFEPKAQGNGQPRDSKPSPVADFFSNENGGPIIEAERINP